MSKGRFSRFSLDEPERILAGIRDPEGEHLMPYYVTNKSEAVAKALLTLVNSGEAEKAVGFIVSDATRFETLAEKGQMNALMDFLDGLDTAQKHRVISASESVLSGVENATVLQNILSTRDTQTIGD